MNVRNYYHDEKILSTTRIKIELSLFDDKTVEKWKFTIREMISRSSEETTKKLKLTWIFNLFNDLSAVWSQNYEPGGKVDSDPEKEVRSGEAEKDVEYGGWELLELRYGSRAFEESFRMW